MSGRRGLCVEHLRSADHASQEPASPARGTPLFGEDKESVGVPRGHVQVVDDGQQIRIQPPRPRRGHRGRRPAARRRPGVAGRRRRGRVAQVTGARLDGQAQQRDPLAGERARAPAATASRIPSTIRWLWRVFVSIIARSKRNSESTEADRFSSAEVAFGRQEPSHPGPGDRSAWPIRLSKPRPSATSATSASRHSHSSAIALTYDSFVARKQLAE